MTLVDLLNHVGLDSVRFQLLNECVCGATKNQKTGLTKVTFETKEFSPNDLVFPSNTIGLIVWLPKDKMPKP